MMSFDGVIELDEPSQEGVAFDYLVFGDINLQGFTAEPAFCYSNSSGYEAPCYYSK